MRDIFRDALNKIERRFSTLQGIIFCGINWGVTHLDISFDDIHIQAGEKVAQYLDWLKSANKNDAESQRNTLKMYTGNLWCIIYLLIVKMENMGYWPKESGLMNCQSAVFYLDNVVENLKKITEDLGKTAKKLDSDGQPDRSLKCVHLTHSFRDLREKVTGIRNYINRGL